MLKLIKWALLLVLLLIVVLPIALVFIALEDQPRIVAQHQLNQQNVKRIKYVLRDADPRWLRVGDSRQLSLVEDDFNLILNYGLSHFWQGSVDVELMENKAHSQWSLQAPPPFEQKYINTSFTVHAINDGFSPSNWQLGRVPIPDWLATTAANWGHQILLHWDQYQSALAALEEVVLAPQAIQVRYHWRQDLKEQLRNTGRDLLFNPADQARMVYYHEKIYLLSRQIPRRASLTELLAELFDSAARQSTNAESAVLENRALLLALTFHLARVDIKNFVSDATHPLSFYWLFWPELADRYDLARHFVISAGIAASAGTNIAAGAGLFKELKDSQGGSGFSFADLAADKAGTRFAQMALDPETALAVQSTMRAASGEELFMPDVAQLPEGIQEEAFTAQFADLDNDAYRAISAEIERRISRCELYQL